MEETNSKKEKDKNENEPRNEEKLAKKVIDFIAQWLDGFTMHGFANINRTDSNIIKVIWAILIVGLIGYCIYCNLLNLNLITFKSTINSH